MKKIALALASLFYTAKIFAALPTTASDFHVSVPLLNPGFELGAAALFLAPATLYQDYAVVYPKILLEDGHFKNSRPPFDIGYQFYVGYRLPCSGNDVRLTYTEYFQKSSDHTRGPEGLIVPGNNTLPLIAIPAITGDINFELINSQPEPLTNVRILTAANVRIEANSVAANVTEEFKQQVMDFDFGQYMDVDTFVRIRFMSGLRYARIKYRFNTTYLQGDLTASQSQTTEIPVLVDQLPVEVVPATTTMTLTSSSQFEFFELQSSKFTGIGPRIGVEGTFHLGGSFGLIGSLSAAFLVGKQHGAISQGFEGSPSFQVSNYTIVSTPQVTSIELTNLSLPVGSVISTTPTDIERSLDANNYLRIVPNLESKIAIDYTYLLKKCRTFTLELGYYVNHYFNAINRFSVTSFNQPETQNSKQTMDASFHGPYINIEFTF